MESLFEPLGISFGPEQTYKINIALRMLSERQNAKNIRFWGKILTTHGDYFVIQGQSKKNKQPIVSNDMQKYGQGANLYSFWVCNQLLSEDWYQLPLITPEQIRISRLVKYTFTGKLRQNVRSYPVFPGEERHLLKCQLVRITHNCQIVPKELYKPVEQQNIDDIELAQTFEFPSLEEFANLESWVHQNPYILTQGRSSYFIDPKLTEQQKQELQSKLQQTDPKIDRLRGINQDKPLQEIGLQTGWVVNNRGNKQVFSGKQEGSSVTYGSIVLKNPHWPGWMTTANYKNFGSIYIGYAYKWSQCCFYPNSPEDIEIEGEDIEGYGQPNPRDPPDELEPDSDDEGKKEDDI